MLIETSSIDPAPGGARHAHPDPPPHPRRIRHGRLGRSLRPTPGSARPGGAWRPPRHRHHPAPAPPELGRAEWHRHPQPRRADLRVAAAHGRAVEAPALPGRALGALERQPQRHAAPAQGRGLPRRPADHRRGREVQPGGDPRQPPLHVDVRAAERRDHQRPPYRGRAPGRAAPGRAAGDVHGAQPHPAGARVQRRRPQAPSAQCHARGLGPVQAGGVQARRTHRARALRPLLPEGSAAPGPHRLQGVQGPGQPAAGLRERRGRCAAAGLGRPGPRARAQGARRADDRERRTGHRAPCVAGLQPQEPQARRQARAPGHLLRARPRLHHQGPAQRRRQALDRPDRLQQPLLQRRGGAL